MSGSPPDADRIRVLRESLTATGAGIYLAAHVAGPLLAESVAAVHASDDLELRIGRAGPDRAADLDLREREARAAVAAAIHAPFERVLLSHGAADGARRLTLATLAARPEPGARVLAIEGLAAPVLQATEQAAAAAHAFVEVLPEAPRILPGDVALVAMAHVDADGRLAEPSMVASAAHRAGARLLVDASLSVGAIAVDVARMDADIIVADVDRWLLGPEALALVWLSPALGDELPARLMEASGAFGRGRLLSLARSVGWLLMHLGLPWAIERTTRLGEELHAGLAAIHGVQVVAEGGPHAAMAAIRIAGWEAEQAADELLRSVSAITDPDVEADLLRLSVGAWNDEAELARFVAQVAELAAHSPATLPRKPSLTVISGPLGVEP